MHPVILPGILLAAEKIVRIFLKKQLTSYFMRSNKGKKLIVKGFFSVHGTFSGRLYFYFWYYYGTGLPVVL